MKGVRYKLVNTFIFGSRNRHDRNSEQCLHVIDPDGAAIASDLVHHVEGENHRDIELDQLHREIQVSFYIRRIDNINDTLRLLTEDILARYDFFIGIWG